MARLGIISDTHGLLRPEALTFLSGCDHIVHGGDIGSPEVLAQLSTVAAVTAVRGNIDRGDWANQLPETELFEFGGKYIYVLHDLSMLDIAPLAAGVHVVVSGHTHKPVIMEREGILYVNPGGAGPRRFRLPVTVAELVIVGGVISTRIVELEVGGAA